MCLHRIDGSMFKGFRVGNENLTSNKNTNRFYRKGNLTLKILQSLVKTKEVTT